MSRTDVHRPWPVLVGDPHERHRFYRFATWPWQMDLVPVKNLCGCRMCTGHHWRKQANRRNRADGRAALRSARYTPANDRDTIDIPTPRAAAW